MALLLGSSTAYACKKESYTIGVQAIDYSPHYNFVDENRTSYFTDYVKWLNKHHPCQFKVVSLPIKRLNYFFEQGEIDFIYPDNPNWHDQVTANSRIYSQPLVTALGGTMVNLLDEYITMKDFKRLAFPRGFTPIAWLPIQAEYLIEFSETNSAKAALLMVQAGRAQGADVEWNVANYLIQQHSLEPMALGKYLPFTPTEFHIATLNHKSRLTEINQLMHNNREQLDALKRKLNIQESIETNHLSVKSPADK
ncbi:hypothetical protein [Thalassotalea fusca]